jgi:hypothetical protein
MIERLPLEEPSLLNFPLINSSEMENLNENITVPLIYFALMRMTARDRNLLENLQCELNTIRL